MTEQYVIVGNGIAGMTAAEILRTENDKADITVIADDPFPVYYRPALKDYLAGRVREEKLWARPNSFYQDHRIRFLAERVVRIQVGQHLVQLASGRQIGYTKLLLASGARASRLTCPGVTLAGVTTLRTVADYQGVQQQLSQARRVVVTGSGTLAMETIETLRHRGYDVTHLLRKRTLWSEVLDATASDLVLQQERRDGVDVLLEEEIAEITGKDGHVTGITTSSGARIPCEMVIIAIGVDPAVDFVKSSGIPCGRGMQVDAAMRSSAPDIYAAGDILETTDTATGRTRVLGQWYPAIQQARAAAYSMLDMLDTRRPFQASNFYNATFLYGLEFASVGLTQAPRGAQGYQELVADPEPRSYRKVLLKNGAPVGMLFLGNRKDALAFKRAIDHGVNLAPVAAQLFSPDFKLNAWLDKQGVPPPILTASKEGLAGEPPRVDGGATVAASVPLPSVPPALPVPHRDAFLVPAAPGDSGAPGNAGEVKLNQEQAMTVGRQAGVFLLIDHASVSRRHAEITYENGHYVLRDLGSSNGTFVNETRLETGTSRVLESGQRLRFGHISYQFQLRSSQAGQEQRKASAGAAKAMGTTYIRELTTGFFDPLAEGAVPAASYQPVLNADGSLKLPGAERALPAGVVASFKDTPALVALWQGDPQVHRLKRGQRLTIGRDKQNDISLAEIAASRKHAEVFFSVDGWYVHDLDSSNGVMVNSTKIDGPYRLSHCDRILIGSTPIYFMHTTLEESLETVRGVIVSVASAGQPASREARPQEEAMWQCQNCGVMNPPIARFCANCGTPAASVAPVMSQGKGR
jgi:NADPH-dependent 2,4-dienoyl-CoA reductase/sulfur reductase-like enzyme/pSer/pThr/pTyr-binding forkhead associated (FHA) protein